MAVNGESKDENPKEIKKVKKWIGWSWTYLWGVWFLTMIFLLYILRNPLKLRENMCSGIFNMKSQKSENNTCMKIGYFNI